jgi:hypothetical protein
MVKSLHRIGCGAMALTIGRKSKLPWKYFSSHRTEMAEA